MARSHSVVFKTVLVFAAVLATANLLCFTADAEVAADPAMPPVAAAAPPPPPSVMDCYHSAPALPDCYACCERAGHPGGYVKGDVCICSSV